MPTKVKLGKPLPPVKGDIPAPTEAEIALLVSNWDTFAPTKYKGMLSAVPYSEFDNYPKTVEHKGNGGVVQKDVVKKPAWFYDDERGRYISRSGRVILPRELRQAYLDFKKAMDKR